MITNSEIMEAVHNLFGQYQQKEDDCFLVIAHVKENDGDSSLGSIVGKPVDIIAAIVYQMHDNENIRRVLQQSVKMYAQFMESPDTRAALDSLRESGTVVSHINKTK
jgi:UDP-N-acetylglucosamine 2-epimerase